MEPEHIVLDLGSCKGEMLVVRKVEVLRALMEVPRREDWDPVPQASLDRRSEAREPRKELEESSSPSPLSFLDGRGACPPGLLLLVLALPLVLDLSLLLVPLVVGLAPPNIFGSLLLLFPLVLVLALPLVLVLELPFLLVPIVLGLDILLLPLVPVLALPLVLDTYILVLLLELGLPDLSSFSNG